LGLWHRVLTFVIRWKIPLSSREFWLKVSTNTLLVRFIYVKSKEGFISVNIKDLFLIFKANWKNFSFTKFFVKSSRHIPAPLKNPNMNWARSVLKLVKSKAYGDMASIFALPKVVDKNWRWKCECSSLESLICLQHLFLLALGALPLEETHVFFNVPWFFLTDFFWCQSWHLVVFMSTITFKWSNEHHEKYKNS